MSGKIKLLALLSVLLIGASSASIQNDKLFEIKKNIELFINAYKALNADFVDELDPGKLMGIGITAMVESLDPYTNYITESKIEGYRLKNLSKYQGMGAEMEKVDDYVTILEPLEGGPSHNAGLKAGDKILSINNKPTKGKSKDEINALAMGAPGTKMFLQVERGNNTIIEVELTRGETNIPNVPHSGRITDNIGYINLATFTKAASTNITKALKKLKTEGNLDGLVLDLRDNGGGLLVEAINICNIFVEKDIEVVTTKGKIKERDRSLKTRNPVIDPEIPLVVLINGSSASASEIVSGVVQDLDRGVIVGQRSFGKGLVQNTKDIGYNSKLKLTTSKYYIPSGRCIQGVEYDNGIPVDIPDDQRSKFKTKNGRIVLDGGGITPDVKMPENKFSEYTQWTLDEYLIFNYVNEWVLKYDSIAEAGIFKFNDFEDFKSFIKKSDKIFTPSISKELNNLLASKNLSDSEKKDLETLARKYSSNHQNDIDIYKNEIIRQIEIEIISRYYYQKGKVKQQLNGDPVINEAIAILNDTKRYKNILK